VVNRGRYRIGGLGSAAAAALAAGAFVPAAVAQQTVPSAPAPTPTPSGRLPNVMYLPNTSLGGTPTPAPAPPILTVAPVAAPTPAPLPAATATPRAAAPERATPAPAPARAAPGGQPTPLATQAPAPPAPLAAATSTPAAPLPQAVPAAAPAGMPGWLWALLGAGATALIFGGAWALRRRRGAAEGGEALEEALVAVAPPPAPPAPARPVAPPPGIAPPPPAPAAVPTGEPFEVQLRPTSIEVTERDVLLDFELLIGNVQASAAENIRVMMAMMSANPDQDRQIAGYHANPMVDQAGNAFDLAPGAGGRMPARLALPRELIHVVEVQRRPMFVPLVMIELKWRAGISIRRFGADFMVGSAGQGAKLGPIWLDRNQQATQLAATRYFVRQAAAA
jgi:hypothetical protein